MLCYIYSKSSHITHQETNLPQISFLSYMLPMIDDSLQWQSLFCSLTIDRVQLTWRIYNEISLRVCEEFWLIGLWKYVQFLSPSFFLSLTSWMLFIKILDSTCWVHIITLQHRSIKVYHTVYIRVLPWWHLAYFLRSQLMLILTVLGRTNANHGLANERFG